MQRASRFITSTQDGRDETSSKAAKQKIFHLEPRVLYLDEDGKYKFYEPKPVTVTVKKLGISGWLKGPSR